MKYFRKLTLLFSTVLIVLGMLLITSCGTSDNPLPDTPVSADNIVGNWSAFNVVAKETGNVNFVGEMIFNEDKKGIMHFDGSEESGFDWKSTDSTVTITDLQFGIQVWKRDKNEKDDQLLSIENVVDEFTEVITMTLTRK